MKFIYVSDIHLEFRKSMPTLYGDKNDNIFLLGDIGIIDTDIYIDFLKHCCEKYLNVFVIFGNHEFYQRVTPCKTMK